MSIKIKANITTERGTHEITLPQDQNTFDKSLADMQVYDYDFNEYKIENARSGIEELDDVLTDANNIEELNYLAQILESFNENDIEMFEAILSADEIITMRQVVNTAYNINKLNFNIESSVSDVDDLGRLYAEDNDPEIDDIIIANTDENGEIDYEGIGVDLQLSQGGVFSDIGYIWNYDEMTNNPYDGKYFPPFYYGDDVTLALGVKLTKRGEEKGVDIFLPAAYGVKRRAAQRIGELFDKCKIKLCWGFPAPLAGKTFPATDFDELDTITKKLSVLTPQQLRDVLDMADNADINIVEKFGEFCAEQIQQIQMPEATNTLTYYFPLDVKIHEKNDYYGDEEDEYECQEEYLSIAPSEAVYYIEEILGQIEENNSRFDTNRMLAEYFHDDSTLGQKIYNMIPTVETHGGELWGAMVMKVAGELTPDEVIELKDYITGQNSDGYGEGLEQREIQVNNGEIYVSFWSNNKNYTVYTQDEFKDLQNKRQTASSGARQNNIKRLPDCPMIGANGNVYNLIGLVSRTLKDHGMYEKATEMRERVTSCGSYNEALCVMMEYVNPVSQEDMRHSGGSGMKFQ